MIVSGGAYISGKEKGDSMAAWQMNIFEDAPAPVPPLEARKIRDSKPHD